MLTGANLSGADARGAVLFAAVLPNALLTNFISTDGHVSGFDLGPDQLLVVRDYDGDPFYSREPTPIAIDQHFVMGTGGTRRMVFEADVWDSTISFAAGIPVARGGTRQPS